MLQVGEEEGLENESHSSAKEKKNPKPKMSFFGEAEKTVFLVMAVESCFILLTN